MNTIQYFSNQGIMLRMTQTVIEIETSGWLQHRNGTRAIYLLFSKTVYAIKLSERQAPAAQQETVCSIRYDTELFVICLPL